MQVKLYDDKIKYIIRDKKRGTSNIIIAKNMNISTRHVRRLCAKHKNTDQVAGEHVKRSTGRGSHCGTTKCNYLVMVPL